MPIAGLLMRILLVVLILTLAAPVSSAIGNSASVGVRDTEAGAVASCQLLVVVNALVLLGLEDQLGLVSAPAPGPAVLSVTSGEGALAAASCDVLVERLTIRYTDGGGAARSGSYVTGPPVQAPAPETWAVAAVAACSRVILVNAVILGGGAYGLEPGPSPSILEVPSAASASCRVEVGETSVE